MSKRSTRSRSSLGRVVDATVRPRVTLVLDEQYAAGPWAKAVASVHKGGGEKVIGALVKSLTSEPAIDSKAFMVPRSSLRAQMVGTNARES